MYHIVADSGCDIFELEGAASFATAALTISTDKDHFVDDETLDTKQLVEHMLSYKGRSYTACPSVEKWMEAFMANDGSVPEEIFVVTLTSGLSGTYNSACIAKDMFLEQHPEVKMTVIDSLSVGPEMRVILEKIVELKNDGRSFEEVESMMGEYVKKARLFFAFKSLHNLAQNGRVNKVIAAAAGVLGISVYGTASEAGEIAQLGKARGDQKVIAGLLEEMKKADYHGGRVRITNVENEELANKMADAIHALYPEADIKIYPVRGLCAYYCERGGMCIGMEA